MIDIQDEQLIPLRDVPKLLPKRGNGKRIHISAIYRWTQRGVRGVRLESIRIGGTTYTSKEALQRFSVESSQPNTGSRETPRALNRRRQKEIERASREAKRILGPNRNSR